MGPHPALAEVRQAVRVAIAADANVLVACSGGADSLALAAAAAFECRTRRAGLITVDHALQPGSHAQAVAVAAIGYELGFDPVEIVRVEVSGSGGPEASARRARYAALDATAVALDAVVLLGHTLDDQAETVLLGLGRGSGPRSIAGMRPADGRYRRPFLGVRRSTTEAACAAIGLTPWRDPHNDDPHYQRVRLRHEVLPLLEDVLHGGVAEALARTAALTRADLEALDEIAGAISPTAGDGSADQRSLDVAELDRQPLAVRTRVLRTWVSAAGAGPLAAGHLAALDALITGWHGQGAVDLPGGSAVVRASGRLHLQRRQDPQRQPEPQDLRRRQPEE
jgi:tRNA(Ile)-lysidine synthase